VYAIYLLILLAISTWIVHYYPHSVAVFLLLALVMVLVSLSVWIFDAFYIWVPISSAVIQTAVLFIVTLTYQVSYNEQKAWRLEQEQLYMREIEQLKGNFLSLISHDLKTPIAKIQAIVDRLLGGVYAEPIAKDLKSLKASSQELHRYIHSILQVSRVEARELKILKVATDPNELVKKAIEQIYPLAHEKSIFIESHLEPLFAIEVDAILVGEVILNLIDNAVKYTAAGGQIRVQTREIDEVIEFKVEDTGEGIPQEDLKHIWEKFYRAQNQVTNSKGTGLGLYLVKYFIELHGGNVFITSELGKGTTVGFHLPLQNG
jgi:signal transduction histidine kinase